MTGFHLPEGVSRSHVSDQASSECLYYSSEIEAEKEKLVCSMGYRKYIFSDSSNYNGQDFAVVTGDRDFVIGIVADGVGQSFYGDIAAREVSQCLVSELWEKRREGVQKSEIETRLKKLEQRVKEEISSTVIPENTHELIKKALERNREKGTQTVFTAFVLDRERKTIYLVLVGDVTALIFKDSAAPEIIRAENPNGRWSSEGKSKLLIDVKTFEDIYGIVLKSDGAAENWGINKQDIKEEAFKKMAEESAYNDDVSFVSAFIFGSKATKTEPEENSKEIEGNATSKILDSNRHKQYNRLERWFYFMLGFLLGFLICILSIKIDYFKKLVS